MAIDPIGPFIDPYSRDACATGRPCDGGSIAPHFRRRQQFLRRGAFFTVLSQNARTGTRETGDQVTMT
jgi:hypothetical protein